MSNGLDESLQEVLNELPGRVSNRLLLGTLIEIRTSLSSDLETLNGKVEGLDRRLVAVERAANHQRENPSITWLLRYRPAAILGFALRVALALGLIAGAANVTDVIEAAKTLIP